MQDYYKPLTGDILWLDCGNRKNTLHCFYYELNIEQIPALVPARIAAETVYRLWINGQMVICEGPVHRESQKGCGWFDNIDIAKYLTTGKNSIAAQVWFWGNGGRNNTPLEQGGFLFDCPTLGMKPENWFYAEQPALYTLTADTTSYLYGGYDIGWDATKALTSDWMTGNKEGFVKATVIGTYPCAPFGTLFKSPILPYGFDELCEYSSVSVTDFVIEAEGFNHSLSQLTASLPTAAHVYPYFKVKALAGQKIDVRTDRHRINGGPGDEKNVYKAHRVEYVTVDGINEFESFDWLFGEKVIYTVPKDVEVLSLGFRKNYNTATAVGTFTSSDPLLDTLIRKATKTLEVCMRGNYMDCPDRERGQWIGDVSGQVPQTFYALNRTADLLTKKAIADFINLRNGDVLQGNVPGICSGELPSQSLNAISDIGMIMTYCFFSGDFSPIETAFDVIKNYLALWGFSQNGEVIARNGNWRWYDHKDNIDADVLEYCWLCEALKAAMAFSRLLGKRQEFINFSMSYDWLVRVANVKFWDGKGYKSGELYDDRVQAMVILSGIAVGPNASSAAKLLCETEYATPYMEYYILEALFAAGMDFEAVARMKRRYKPLADNENTTLWEDFSVLGTRNHAWSGGPLTIGYKHLAGISPLKAGFEEILIAPSAAAPSSIDCSMETCKGPLSVCIRRKDEGYSISVTMPEGCTAIVGLPKSIIGESIVSGASPYYHKPDVRPEGLDFVADINSKSLLDDEGNPPHCARKIPVFTHRLFKLEKSGTVYCEYKD